MILPAPGLAYVEQEDQRPFMVLIMLLADVCRLASDRAMPAKSAILNSFMTCHD